METKKEITKWTKKDLASAARVMARDWAEREGDESEAVCLHLAAARAAGRKWAWDEAEKEICAAYRAAGETPSKEINHGYAWHCGLHPLQVCPQETLEDL